MSRRITTSRKARSRPALRRRYAVAAQAISLSLAACVGAGGRGIPTPPAAARVRDSLLRVRDSLSHVNVDQFVPRVFVGSDGTRVPYRLFVPPTIAPGVRYPMVVWLHGGGGVGSDNYSQVAGDQIDGTRIWTTPEHQAEQPAFVLVPQAPSRWHVVDDTNVAATRPLGLVPVMISALEAEFPIDPARLYVAGQSLGGAGAWALISSAVNPFAAAIILCPVEFNKRGDAPVDEDVSHAARAAGVAIWIFQGDHDDAAVHTRALVAALKAAGGTPRYTAYPDLGHEIWTRAFQEPGLVEWLYSQHKKDAPP